jgi:hypothetical protein
VDWVPEGKIVNRVYYREVLTNLREGGEEEDLMWKNGSCVLYQDHTPAHNALSRRF